MHKTLSLSWHLLTWKNSFKLVSVRNMTSTLVWRWLRGSHFMFVCTLINTHYNFQPFLEILPSVKSHQKHISGKEEGNRNAKKPLVKECTHKGKNAMTRKKEIIHHRRLTKRWTQRAKLKWFSIRFSLFLTIWPVVQPSSRTFGSASYTGFLTEERRKEKGALFMKVMFVLIVHKKEVPAGSKTRRKDIQSQRKTTTSFTGKEFESP